MSSLVNQTTEHGIASAERPRLAGGAVAPRLLQSEELLAGENQVWIEHRGERYCLRLTSSGKLYLTK